MNLKDYIRAIKDYPKKGILFRDITTLIKKIILIIILYEKKQTCNNRW